MTPLSSHQAIALFCEHKTSTLRNARDAENIGIKLRQLVPDILLSRLDRELAKKLSSGNTTSWKFGVLKPATHHSRLRLARECWNWLMAGDI